MKVLMVTHYFASHPGGIEIVADQIFQRLATPECRVTWAAANVTPTPEPSPCSSTLPLKTWNGLEKILGLPLPVPAPQSLKRLWSAVGVSDVVLLHDCLYVSNMGAFLFARIRRIPVVIIQHIATVPYGSLVANMLMKLANRMITKRMLKAANQVVFISQITQRHFQDVRFIRPPMLVFNGVDTRIFHPPADASVKVTLRRQLGLPLEKLVVLFVGRFVEKKGLHILKNMAVKHSDVTWAFAGSGPLTPNDWRLAHVKVYSDLSGASLADLYRAADVFVLPSTGEGFPLVIQEALACGLPVVCNAETAAADDALAPFVRAVPLTPGDDERSAHDFLVATKEELLAPVSQANIVQRFRFVQSRYSWSHMAQSYGRILSTVVSGAHGSQRKRSSENRASDPEDINAEKVHP